MKGTSFILLVFYLASCTVNDTSNETDKFVDSLETKVNEVNNEDVLDKLARYFDLYRIEPWLEVNNIDGDQTEVQLGNHRIIWLNAEEETKIKIDDELFTLKGKVTINPVWEEHKDSVDFAGAWDQMKLFKHNGREYIGIRMQFSPCNGLACGVNYILIYDVASKSKNFFGTFRGNENLELFDFSNDDKLDYVSNTFIGDAHGATPVEYICELYSMDSKDQFELQ